MSVVQEIIWQWRRTGVTLNPGASPTDIETLQGLLGCEIPADIRAFYSDANGMAADVSDDHVVSFWSLHKMREERGTWGDMEVGFADVLLNSWRFIFRVESGRIVVVSQNVSPGSPMATIGSFSTFLGLYLTKPDVLRI